MGFKMKRSSFKMDNTTTNSPLQQGILECTECDWTDEAIGEPMDTATVQMHYMSEHNSPGPGTGTPGYVAPKDPWGTNWGDTPNTGGDNKAPEPKRN